MVKAYFTACEQAFPAKRTQLMRLSPGSAPGRSGAHGAALRHTAGRTGKVVGNPINRGKEPAADCGGLRPI